MKELNKKKKIICIPLIVGLGLTVIVGVLFNRSEGIAGMLRGGVLEIGEFLKFIKNARS